MQPSQVEYPCRGIPPLREDKEAALTGENPALAWMIKCATGAIYGQLKRLIICPNPLLCNDLTHANKTLSRKTFHAREWAVCRPHL